MAMRLSALNFFTLIVLVSIHAIGNFALAEQREVNQESMRALLARYPGRVNFIGHGSKSQFKSVDDVKAQTDLLVAELNEKYGAGKWIAMFGGDGSNPEKPDIGFAMKYLKEKHGIPLMAVQSDVVKAWGGVDPHIDFVRWVPTTYEPKRDSAGNVVVENGKPQKQIVWGGFKKGKAVGPTSILLGTGKNRIATEMVALGSGPIGAQEFRFAQRMGLPSKYLRIETRFPEVNGTYGSLDAIAKPYKFRTCPGSFSDLAK